MEGILIGTAVLWLLTAVLVAPLTNWSVKRRMALAAVGEASLDDLPPDEKAHWEGLATRHYILWDVVVLTLAGLVGGLLGFWFVGVSLNAKGWPGMIAFIATSFLTSALVGGV